MSALITQATTIKNYAVFTRDYKHFWFNYNHHLLTMIPGQISRSGAMCVKVCTLADAEKFISEINEPAEFIDFMRDAHIND